MGYLHTKSDGTIGPCVGPPSTEHPNGCRFSSDGDHIMASSQQEMEEKLAAHYNGNIHSNIKSKSDIESIENDVVVSSSYANDLVNEVISDSSSSSPEPVKISNARDLMSRALSSDLKNKKDKPDFWDDVYGETNGNNVELLDTFEYEGKNISVVWENDSVSDEDKSQKEHGFNVNRLMMYDDEGNEVDRLLVKSMSENSFERAYGDDEYSNFRYAADYSGNIVLKDTIDSVDEAMDDEMRLFAKQELWAEVSNPDKRLDPFQAPESEEQIDSDLSKAGSHWNRDINEIKSRFNIPMIDYAHVDKEHKGKGLGTASYLYAARKLGANGQRLRSSTVRSDDAKALWKRMDKNYPDNMSFAKLDNENIVAILDFR